MKSKADVKSFTCRIVLGNLSKTSYIYCKARVVRSNIYKPANSDREYLKVANRLFASEAQTLAKLGSDDRKSIK